MGEFQVSKLSYTIDHLYSKYDEMLDKFEILEQDRDSRLAQLARKQFPYILDHDYDPGKKGKGKVSIIKYVRIDTANVLNIWVGSNNAGKVKSALQERLHYLSV